MVQINWQGEPLNVCRLVFRPEHDSRFSVALGRLAALFRLDVADDRADPRPGDFWVGCHPLSGWGDADPTHTGWAGLVDVPLAVGALRRRAFALATTDETVLDTPGFAVAFG